MATILAVPVFAFVSRDRPITDPQAHVAEAKGTTTSNRSTVPVAMETLLVFHDGDSAAVAVDFEQGVVARRPLPGPRPEAEPFQLGRLDGQLIVTSDRVWAMRLDTGAQQALGTATGFLPDAHPDRLWLVDDPGEDPGSEVASVEAPTTLTLIDSSGSVLHRLVARPGMAPVRGVPDGLALQTEQGLKIYDMRTQRIVFYVGAPRGVIGDVTRDRVAWCRPGCDRLTVTGGQAHLTRLEADGIISFEIDSVWLSPDGTHVAAVARSTTPATDGVREVLVFDVDRRTVLARHRLPSGDLHGGWSTDSTQFFFAVTVSDRTTRVGRFRRGLRWFETRDHDGLGTVDDLVALPRTSVAG